MTDVMREIMKSCPFCGGEKIGCLRPGGSWQFVCMAFNCGAAGPAHDDRKRAAELWNDRAVLEALERIAEATVHTGYGETFNTRRQYSFDYCSVEDTRDIALKALANAQGTTSEGGDPPSFIREAVARIIEPCIWDLIDAARGKGHHKWADDLGSSSLTKADAILSLTSGRR